MDSNSKQNEPLYSVLVAGDVDITKYDYNIKVEPYIAYKYDSRANIRQQAIEIHEKLIEKFSSNNENEDYELVANFLNIKLQEIEDMTDEEYFDSITKGMTYDKNTGDAITTLNPNSKYKIIKEPTLTTAMPLVNDSFKCKVSDLPDYEIDENIKCKSEKHWDYIMNNCNKIAKDNLLNRYGDKETYIKVMTEPMFYNAFVSKETGWIEQCDENQVEWVLTFRERFINNLSKDTELKVYNFIK